MSNVKLSKETMVCPHCRAMLDHTEQHDHAEQEVFNTNRGDTFYFNCPKCNKRYSIHYYLKVVRGTLTKV